MMVSHDYFRSAAENLAFYVCVLNLPNVTAGGRWNIVVWVGRVHVRVTVLLLKVFLGVF